MFFFQFKYYTLDNNIVYLGDYSLQSQEGDEIEEDMLQSTKLVHSLLY